MIEASVTLNQIAKQVGVSPRTVANALGRRVPTRYARSAARAEEIRRVAREMGYRPNEAARATATGRFNTISLIIGSQFGDAGCGYLPHAMQHGVNVAAHDAGLLVSMAALTDEELVDDSSIPHLLRRWCSDGILMNYAVRMPPHVAELLSSYAIPTIYMNVKRDTDSVHPDDEDMAHQATRRLIQMGHRRVVYLGPIDAKQVDYPEFHYSGAARAAGYTRAMTEAGLMPLPVDDASLWGAHLATLHWSEVKAHRPTAVLTYGGDVALRAMHAALAEGFSVPRDLSIATFDDHERRGCARQPFTGMMLPFEQVGREAVAMLQRRIAGPDKPVASVAIPGTWYEGATCAPPS